MPPTDGQPKQRISIVMAILLLMCAGIVGGLQALLDLTGVLSIASSILGLAADFGFLLWFALLDVNYTDKNALLKWITIGGMTIGTAIPEVNIFFEITIGVGLLIAQVRLEDSLKDPKFANKVATAAKIVGMVQPELEVGAAIVEQQAKRQAALAQARQQQEAKQAAAQQQEQLMQQQEQERALAA